MAREDAAQMVGYCGLYCANCGRHTKGKCPGCRNGGGFDRCAVRKCCASKSIPACSGCGDFERLADCKKLNNFISKAFGFIFKTDRLGNLESVRKMGIDAWVAEKRLTNKP